MKRASDGRVAAGVALTVLSAVGYSLSLVLARLSYDHGTNALSIMLIRFMLMVGLMLVWNRARRIPLRLGKRELLICFLSGGVYFLGIGAYLSSVGYLPVSLAVLIFYTFPLLTALLSALIERRWPTGWEVLTLLIAFLGLGLALGVEGEGVSKVGLAFGVIASLGVALNMIVSTRALKSVPVTVFSLHMALAALLCSALAVATTGSFALPQAAPGWVALGLSLVAFVIAYLALYKGLPLIGPVRLSMVMNLEPVVTILIAGAILKESLSGLQIVGGGIVIAAVVLAQFRRDGA